MNNLERIQEELASEAKQRAPALGIPPEMFLEIALTAVDLEDQHRLVQLNINQELATMIENGAAAREVG
jgi:hypothetical protein